MSEPKRSQYPDSDANPHWDDSEWEESERPCDECGALMWSAPWFDDPPDMGGACIGTKYRCGDCGNFDSE